MKKEMITRLHADFERLVKTAPDSDVEFWYGRDLQEQLGYSKWENFTKVIEKAKTACANSDVPVEDHFIDVNKMVTLGSGAQREIEDVMLTRYACYLIAQNGDPAKEAIAFAQTYFAVQTRKQEIIESRLAEVERLMARQKLSASEKELSAIIFERLGDGQSFGRIRSKGDQALFGGNTTQDMKNRLAVPDNRPLADFLPTITIKAKDFANEITVFQTKQADLKSEPAITKEHVKNNSDVRQLLIERDIVPENLPADEDMKKVERRLESEKKKLPKSAQALPKGKSKE
ncbi:MAG: DNA damage-inducible protein D [Prosthecobacter sp.]